MGEDLEGVGGPVAARREHPVPEHRRPGAGEHPSLAPELRAERRRHRLPGDRARLEHGAPASLGELVGEGDVLAAGRLERDVGLTAHRVDRPVAGRDAGEARFEGPDGRLVAPVEPLLVLAALPLEAKLAADVADPRIGEAGHQAPERIGLPGRVGVGEGEHLAARPLDRGVERRHLATPRHLEHQIGAGLRRPLEGAVGRAVRDDDDLEPLARIVEGEGRADPARDARLLVVRGDDQRHAGQRLGHLRDVILGPAKPRQAATGAPGSRGACRRAGRPRPRRRSPGRSPDQLPVERQGLARRPRPRSRGRRRPRGRRPRAVRGRRDRRAARSAPRRAPRGRRRGTSRPAPCSATSPKPPTALITIGFANASATYSTPDCSASRWGRTTRSARRK